MDGAGSLYFVDSDVGHIASNDPAFHHVVGSSLPGLQPGHSITSFQPLPALNNVIAHSSSGCGECCVLCAAPVSCLAEDVLAATLRCLLKGTAESFPPANPLGSTTVDLPSLLDLDVARGVTLCGDCAAKVERVWHLRRELAELCATLRRLRAETVRARHDNTTPTTCLSAMELHQDVTLSSSTSTTSASVTCCLPAPTYVTASCVQKNSSSPDAAATDGPPPPIDPAGDSAVDPSCRTVAVSIQLSGAQDGSPSSLHDQHASTPSVSAPVADTTAESDDAPLRCRYCGKTFKLSTRLSRHELLHASDKCVHKCPTCDKTFSQKYYLNEHVKQVHMGRNVHTCATCGKVFLRRLHLENHVRTHSGERPHVCNVCGRAFAQLGNLRAHLKLHQGMYPLQCDICGRRFRTKSNLDSHVRTHRGDKRHRCHLCPAAFLLKRSLVRHLHAHTSSRPFQCDACGAAFRVQCDLRSHQKTVHSSLCHPCGASTATTSFQRSQQHICVVCGGVFARRYKMAEHIRRKHGQQALREALQLSVAEPCVPAPTQKTDEDDAVLQKAGQRRTDVATIDGISCEKTTLPSVLHMSQQSD